MLSYILKGKDRDTLTHLRSRLEAKGVQVSRMATIEGPECDFKNWTLDQVEFWLALQSCRWHPSNVQGFSAWVGHGCEPMLFGLAQTDQGLIYEGFCETYGDQTPSLEVFEHRHSQACEMLIDAQGVGFDVDVVDLSGYWKSKSLTELRQAAIDTNTFAALIEQAAEHTPLLKIARAMIGTQCCAKPI